MAGTLENVKGSEGADILLGGTGSNSLLTSSIDGGGGNDYINGRAGDRPRSNASGVGIPWNASQPIGPSNQFPGLSGGSGNDSILGEGGQDNFPPAVPYRTPLTGGPGAGHLLLRRERHLLIANAQRCAPDGGWAGLRA